MNNEANKISINRLVTVSAITGILVGIPKFCFTGFFFMTNVIQWFGLQDAGTIVFRTRNFPLDFFHLALAAVTYLLWGGLLAVILGLIYFVTGKKNCTFKGAYFGFFIWIVFRNFFVSISLPQGLPSQNAMTAAITYLSHLLWVQ